MPYYTLIYEVKHFAISQKNARIHHVNKVISFVKEAYYELKMAQWPTKNQTINLTLYVIGVSLGVGIFVSLWDYLFKEMLSMIIR
jgi:preprotein translocase SecE subunit